MAYDLPILTTLQSHLILECNESVALSALLVLRLECLSTIALKNHRRLHVIIRMMRF